MKYLELKWTISKGRDTYGYNIVTLIDRDKKYRASGGGYDMLGTVFGQWLKANYMPKIIELCAPNINDFYGLFKSTNEDKYWIDGACGLDCMLKIAKAIGLEVYKDYRNDSTKGFIIGGNYEH